MPKFKSKNIDKEVGTRLKFLRMSKGLTQQKAADILNINRTTITKYETGVSEPSFGMLAEFAKLYEVDFNYLLAADIFLPLKKQYSKK